MKKRYLLFLLINVFLSAQNYKITYKSFFNEKERNPQDAVILLSNTNNSYLLTQEILEGKKTIPYEIQSINRNTKKVLQSAFLKDNEVIQLPEQNIYDNKNFNLNFNETKKILGYTCKKAEVFINSNKMELWYTNEAKIKGSPYLLGQDLGLVLEVIRNGNASVRAVEMKKIKTLPIDDIFINKKKSSVDKLSYNDLLWKNRFTQIPIFEDEQINFVKEPKKDEKALRFANGTIILKKIKFPKITLQDNVFVELREQSLGDAYDRTGTVFIIPQNKELSFFDALSKGIDSVPYYENGDGKIYKGMLRTQNFEPTIELMRFFTPFGIHKFNHIKLKGKEWHDKVSYRQDISDLNSELSEKELWVGTYIGNYDQGGHKISLEITIHNNGLNVFGHNKAISLFNTLNIMEMAGQTYATMFSIEKGLMIDFTLEKDLQNVQLRFITTGHGGWGNGDEFVPKQHTISLDGKPTFSFTPWRTECGSYRLYNPVSGNFENGLSSSDYSRSNWCPGTTTNPVYIALGNLKAGKHTLQVQIPQGEPEGNNFSYWSVSGVLLGKE